MRIGCTALLAGLLLACGAAPEDPEPPAPAPDAGAEELPPPPDVPVVIPKVLSGYGLFEGSPGPDGRLAPAEGTLPYELTTALFSDYALKARTLTIPKRKTARYREEGPLDFPVGTIFTKTFSFPADLRAPDRDVRVLETRVIVRQPTGWEAHPYVWNAEQTEATLAPGGRVLNVDLIDHTGAPRNFSYLVPSRNQCLQCHHVLDADGKQVLEPIGPQARYLNRDGQLEQLAQSGRLEGLPEAPPRAPNAFDPSTGSLEARARTYLDINCAYCHNPKSTAGDTSRLFLTHDTTDPFAFGVCKRPGSAGGDVGGEFDIVPGDHTQSILWFRLQTEESGKMMPQIGRALAHVEGAKLIADWIDAMPPQACR